MIAALVSVFTIWILTAFLVREAIERVKNPQHIDAKLVSKKSHLILLLINYRRCVLLLPLVSLSTLCKFDSFDIFSCFAHVMLSTIDWLMYLGVITMDMDTITTMITATMKKNMIIQMEMVSHIE